MQHKLHSQCINHDPLILFQITKKGEKKTRGTMPMIQFDVHCVFVDVFFQFYERREKIQLPLASRPAHSS